MAGESLGTMVVGVTANISPAERALTALADMLEKFERKQQARQRSAQTRPPADPMALTKENSGIFSGLFAEIDKQQGLRPRAQQQVDDITNAANRSRYAVLNLAYGLQDAATVFGTGGFAGAVRASANNLSGLGVLLGSTAGGTAGLKAALMSAEFVVIGLATAVMIGADAWDNYQKKLQKAAEESAKAKFERFDAPKAGQEAGRAEQFAIELENARKLTDAEKAIRQVRNEDRVQAAKERAEARVAADLRVEKQRAEAMLAAKKSATEKEAAMLQRDGFVDRMPGADVFRGAEEIRFTAEEMKAMSISELQLKADLQEATRKLKEAEQSVNNTIDERIQLLKEQDAAEKNLRRAKRDDVEDKFNRQFAEGMREMQANEERRIRLGRRDFAESVRKMESDVMDMERRARFDPFANTGAAGRNTAAEYEALVRARAPGGIEGGDLQAMKQLLQEQKEILRKIEENTKETYEGPPPTVDELINGV